MNRRELLLCGLAIPAASVADCRDDNGMINPDGDSSECVELEIRRAIISAASSKMTARAEFHFGAYEDLMRHQKEKRTYPFMFKGQAWRLRVTRVSVDVNRTHGCVLATVQGSLYEA
jgi:hypothetical protein